MGKAPFASDFAILDVKKGRRALLKRIEAGETIPITIMATIECVHSRDDGVSIEFGLHVDRVEIRAAIARA